MDSLLTLGDTLNTTGIEEVKEETSMAAVYPNPFSSKIMIAMMGDKDEAVDIELSDVAGRRVYSEHTSSMGGKIFIEPAVEAGGIYFLRLSTTDRSETYKIVKQ
jgi:hypothetical protein